MPEEELLPVIVIGTGIVLTITGFVIVTVITSQKRFIRIQREKIQESARAEKLLRQLPEKMIEGEEQERKRLARELHDGINQMLASVNYRLHSAKVKYGSDSSLKEYIDELLVDLSKTMEEVRRMSHNLHPKALEEFGFNAAVKRLGEQFEERTGIPVRQSLSALPSSLPKETELGLFRIVQEALNNVEKHAQASEVSIESENGESFMKISIMDDGMGIALVDEALEGTQPRSGGIGLTTIRERAVLLNGEATIEANGDSGTKVVLTIPLRRLTTD